MEVIYNFIGAFIGLALIMFWWSMMFDAWHNESSEDRWLYIGIIFFLSIVEDDCTCKNRKIESSLNPNIELL